MKICIIGTGYVGLVTGVGLAAVGHEVKCVDIDAERVATIEGGEVPFYERGLPELLHQVQADGRFGVTTDAEAAILESDITFIAVGTPTIDGQQDLSAVEAATHTIGTALQHSDDYHVVVVKSTVLPGTTRGTVRDILLSYVSEERFGLCMNPEFLREGRAVDDFMKPDRIVIGASDGKAYRLVREVFEPFNARMVSGSLEAVELVKYASNALLATLISFSNEIGALCEVIPNTDVRDVMRMLHMDHRLTPLVGDEYVRPGILQYLEASFGYGGSCLPKDTRALWAFGQSLGRPMHLMDGVIQVNDERPDIMSRLAEHYLGDLEGKIIAVLGLAFKTGTDDTRESPSLAVVERLLAKGAIVRGYDPKVKTIDYPMVELFETAEVACVEADAVMICVDQYRFIQIAWTNVAETMRTPLIIDGRRFLALVDQPHGSNFRYVQIGMMPPPQD